jgi:hypothetical protein
MSVLDYLFSTPSGQPSVAAPAPQQQQDLISLLMSNSPGDRSPLQSEQGATREAIDYLRNIASRPDAPLESGTPAGAPAPNAGGFTAGRGLGTIGGMVGSLAAGPFGGMAGRGIGTAVGSFADAARANDIAAQFGLGQVADPAAAAAMGLGRSAAMSAAGAVPGLAGAALGVPALGQFGGLASRGVGALSGTPDYANSLMNAMTDRISNEFTDPDEMSAAVTRGLMGQLIGAIDQPRGDVGFGMASDYATNPSFAASDYYDSGMSGMGGETASGYGGPAGPGDNTSAGYAARGGLATPEGFKGPEHFANGGIVQLPGGGKVASGPGGGLDDLIPTSIDGRRAAALSDGEFVIPADVVSMMGDGSSNAGSRRLYDMVRSIRDEKTGTTRQAGPIKVGDILKRIMQ